MFLFLEKTIRAAGQLAMEFHQRLGQLSVSNKGTKDIVTEADIAVEQYIRTQLLHDYPDFGFLGEESGQASGTAGRWIVDPIDGTVSFARGHVHWSISIAVEVNGIIQMGAVYAPMLQALYLAEKGKGAFLNGQPIQVSHIDDFEQAVMATGFACLRSDLEHNNLPRFNRIIPLLRGQRMLGSAALDCCMVADGQLEAFWEQNLNLYDIAAGSLIAEEAGGSVSDFQGKRSNIPQEILVSNGVIHQAMLELM